MSKRTPGLWVAVDGRILPVNYALKGAPIATVHSRLKEGMQDANAALLAASPEMLDALKDAHSHIADDALRTRIGNLIAKAEGGAA